MRSSEENETKWLTTGEAAEVLGTSKNTVRRMIESGRLVARRKPSHVTGREWQREIDPASVSAVLGRPVTVQREGK